MEWSCSRDSGVCQCNALRDSLRDTGRVNIVNIIPPPGTPWQQEKPCWASAAPAQYLNFPIDSETKRNIVGYFVILKLSKVISLFDISIRKSYDRSYA